MAQTYGRQPGANPSPLSPLCNIRGQRTTRTSGRDRARGLAESFEPKKGCDDRQTTDALIGRFDQILRTVFVPPAAERPMPRADGVASELDEQQRQHSAGLMRVNHVGEICAQGLYSGQAAATRNDVLRASLLEAGREEGDHLAWTATRLAELHSRPSLLNPAWYAGSFAMGVARRQGGRRDQPGIRRRDRATGRGTPGVSTSRRCRPTTSHRARSSTRCGTTRSSTASGRARPAPCRVAHRRQHRDARRARS